PAAHLGPDPFSPSLSVPGGAAAQGWTQFSPAAGATTTCGRTLRPPQLSSLKAERARDAALRTLGRCAVDAAAGHPSGSGIRAAAGSAVAVHGLLLPLK
ncbi:hypothetical protein TSOC_003650, partial [Tetrabaena socialis]